MGTNFLIIIMAFVNLLLFLNNSSACIDSKAPFSSKTPLSFCGYNGTSCCSTSVDLNLQKQFGEMNVSDSACSSLLKSILCSRCDPFSEELFKNSTTLQVPVLCNSTSSTQENSFCSKVWNACQNVSLRSSPFSTEKSNSTSLIDHWKSQNVFCNSFGGVSGDQSKCYNGKQVDSLNDTASPTPPSGMCLDKIGNGSYLNMVPHPDGSNRAFFANQKGIVWLGTIPQEGSGGVLEIDEANPFLDLTDMVHFDTEFGLLGIALHPKFEQNGRLFASFNCDKAKWSGCGGRCSCNSDVKCDPSKIGPNGGAAPCQYQSVIAEFTVNGSSPQPSSALDAQPFEVRRIFTMGLPFTSHHGGQILFGPSDGYLYFMMGDGGGIGDPYNFAQNKRSLLGKIMRFDVDTIPSATEISQLDLWGNYSIPKDNPYASDKKSLPEIWASGLRNPWRCSFDSARPSYFTCADVGQDEYEEVNIITKGGNYGWRVYEGHHRYSPPRSPGGNTSANLINSSFPVMGYNHSDVGEDISSASITGGYFYRSITDPCMHGRYLYADLYAGAIWTGIETPEDNGNYNTSKVPFECAHDSSLNCTFALGKSFPALGYIFSFGEDNDKDIYILASKGVFKITRPSRCGFTCSKENVPPAPSPSSPSKANPLLISHKILLLLFFVFVFHMFQVMETKCI